jgi:hypothetical protein
MADTIYSGTATPAQVLSGQTFSAGTNYGASGTMPNNGAVTITPSGSSQTIAAGYHNGSGSVAAVTFDATKVLTGTTIAGTAGTMPNQGSPTWTPTISNQSLSSGYYSGGTVNGDVNLVAANILSGVTIFGVAGSVTPRRTAKVTGWVPSPTTQAQSYTYNASLSFTPTFVVCYYGGYVDAGGVSFHMICMAATDTTNYMQQQADTFSASGQTPGTFSASLSGSSVTVFVSSGNSFQPANGSFSFIFFG